MVGGTVGEVVSSDDPGFKPGDIVLAYTGWQRYGAQSAEWLRKLAPARRRSRPRSACSACRGSPPTPG